MYKLNKKKIDTTWDHRRKEGTGTGNAQNRLLGMQGYEQTREGEKRGTGQKDEEEPSASKSNVCSLGAKP